MNRIFRVIWSQATQSWVAVSELTKAHKKQSSTGTSTSLSQTNVLTKFFTLSLLSTALFGYTATSFAATSINQAGTDTSANDKNATVVWGAGASTSVGGAVVLGMDAAAGGANNDSGIAIGRLAKATGTNAMAVGVNSNAASTKSVALGSDTNSSGENAVALGVSAEASGNSNIAIGNGAKATGNTNAIAMGIGAKATNLDALAVMRGANATGARAMVLGINAAATGQDGLAMQRDAKAVGDNSIAVGFEAQTQQGNSVALGAGAKTTKGPLGVSIGAFAGQNSTTGANVTNGVQNSNIHIGAYSRTGWDGTNPTLNNNSPGRSDNINGRATQSIAIGSGNAANQGAWAEGDQSISIGANTHARGDSSIAIGGDDVDSVANKRITYTKLDGKQGEDTVANALKNLANVSMGAGSYRDTTADGAAVAIGIKTVASDLSLALGSLARAEKVNTVSIGAGAIASLDNSVAIGGGARADQESAGTVELNTTVGSQTYNFAGGENTLAGDIVSFGSKGFERQLKNVAAGKVSRDSRDAINGSQLFTILNTLVSHNYLKYSGDDDDSAKNGANAQKVIHQNLDNNKLTLAGGAAADKLSDNNIGVTYAEGANKDAAGNDIPAFLTYDSNGNLTTDESKIDPTKTKANPAYQNGKLNIKLAKELQGLTSANFTNTAGNVTTLNADGITIKPNATGKAPVSLTQNGLDNGNNPITNVAGNLAGSKTGSTAPSTSGSLATGNDAPNTSNAATVGDVLNAGWNLQGNGAAKDFVKPYDTVNFKNGTGTTAVVDTKADNLLSNISFNVNTTTLTQNATTGNIDAGNSGDYFPTAKTVADAINSTRIKYFSVNSSGGKNEDNKGAFTTPESTNGIAIGKDATIEDRASIAIGLGAKNVREKESNTGKGGELVNQTASSAISVGENATTHFSNSIAIGTNSEARGHSAIVIGHNAKTISPWDDSIDRYNQAYRTTLIGFAAEASGTNTIGIGSRVKALANNAMVFGQDAQSGHVDTIVMGRDSKTQGGTSGSAGSIAIGRGSSSGSADNGRPSTALGASSYVGASFSNPTTNAKPGTDATALEKLRNGPEGLDMSRGATAIGANAGAAYNLVDLLKEDVVDSNTGKTVKAGTPVYRQIVRDEKNNVVEVRFYTSVTDPSDGKGTLIYSYVDMDKINQGYAVNMGTALDNNTEVLKKAGFLNNGLAAPASVVLQETRNTKNGTVTSSGLAYAKTSGASNQQIAVGLQSRAVGNESIAVGAQAIAGDNAVVMGSTSSVNAFSGSYVKVATGDLNTYAANRDQTSQAKDIDLNITGAQGSVLDLYKAQAGRSNLPNWNQDNASYGISGSTVVGSQAHSTAPIGVAVGISSTVARGALGAVAVGPVATVEPNSMGAMALGMGARVQVAANNAIALGTGAEVQSSDASKAEGAMALGWKAKTNKAASVALGSESDGTNRTATKETEGSITHNVAPGVSHTISYSGFAGVPGKNDTLSPNYFVTVGSDTIKRQIKDVAAGNVSATSTDAINGSQLYSVAKLMISGWNIAGDNRTTVEAIAPTEKVSFLNGTGTTSVVARDGSTSNATVTFNVNKSTISNDTTNTGKVQAADSGDNFATAANVANAINSAYWKAAAGGNFDGTDKGADNITAGTTVTFNAGKNLTVNHTTANNFTFATVDRPEFTGVNLTNGSSQVNLTPTADGLNVAKANGDAAKITNVASNLPETRNTANGNNPVTTAQTAPTNIDAIRNNAATVADVLNAGWNLQNNGVAKDFVKPYDTVNFVNGTGTTAVVETKDNLVSNVTFNINTTTLTQNTTTGNIDAGDTGNAFPTAKTVADAINSTRIKYFSVNSEVAGNRLNDGATAKNAIAIGPNATSTAEDALALGHNAKSTQDKATAVGLNATASNQAALALGYNTQATGLGAVAIGTQAGTGQQLGGQNSGSQGTVASGQYATAVGVATTASGMNAFAGGYRSTASNSFGVAIGSGAYAESAGGTAIGLNAWTKSSSTVGIAIGNTATSQANRGVALGSRSFANVEGGVKGIDMSQNRTNRYASLTDETATNLVRTSSADIGAVSIGANEEFEVYDSDTGKVKVDANGNPIKSAAITRQLINLAAGTKDTDAVNVAQLRSVSLQVAGDSTVAGTKADGSASDTTKNPDLLLETGRLDVKGDAATFATTEAKQDGLNATITVKNKLGTITENGNGTVKASDENGLTTAQNVADMINAAYWKAAAGGNVDGTDKGADNITAGTTVTFNAGKNLTVNHTTANNFTFATVANPEFTSVKVGDTVANGKQPVEFKTEAGKTANVNDNQPSTALNVTTTDGKPTQITGVGSVLNTKSHPTNTTGTAGTANLLDLEGTDTNPVNKNAAATVGDLQNMGWIVSAKEGNAYVDTVKNANQVDFVGTGIAKVTGKTVAGIRTITIDANTTSMVNSTPFEYTNKTDNTPLTKANDGKFYPSTQVNPDGTTVNNATPVDDSNVVIHAKGNDPQQVTNVKGNLPQVNDADQTIYNPATNTTTAKQDGNVNINKAPLTAAQAAEIAKNNANNAATVGDVLNAGFNLQNNGEARDFVKPFDTMNFVNGGNTKAVVVTNDAGTSSNISVSVTGLPITYTDAKGNPVAKVGDNYYPVKADGTPDTTATPIQAGDLVTNLANPTAKGNEIGAPTQLGNVANGAKTFDAPKNGNDDLKLANDGKWYPSTQVNPNGTTVANATPVTPSNVGKSGLVDFANSSPNNAATVGDLQNMGWVVSSDKTTGNLSAQYNDQVRNTNEVKFVGTNLATVSGITNATTGVRTITVDVNAQDVVEAAQTPVVYTDSKGNKLVKGNDGNFYPADSVKIGDKYYPAGTTTDATGNPVNNGAAAAPVTGTKPADVIASMNDGNSTTTAPMTLSNVKSNLPNVNDAATTITHPNGTTVAADANNIKKAPLTATQAADIAKNNANNAATVGDVLNAGWNLQNNGEARDFVKPFDTVNFVNGGNTKAVVTTDANGTTSDVAIHVTGLPVTYTDANGNPVAKVGDNYYPVDENGNPITKKADGSDADPIDAKTLKTQLTNPTAKPNAIGDATQLGNVNSGLNNYAEPNVDGKAPAKNSLRNLADSTAVPDTIAATVGDLRNLGWIVSSDKTTGGNGAFSNAVKNANEVRFVGEGSALVSGNVTTDGVNVVTVKVDDQLTTNNSVTPVVYTKADGTKVYPVKDADGNVTYNTQPDGKGDTVADGDVITSVNGPKGTKAPTTLANVKSNLPQVNDADQTIYNPATNTTTAKQDGNANINKAPLTATQAADIAKNNANNAATVGDVLNAGWNLQNNGEARDFVKPFDTVNFVNGGNTKAVVTTAVNGTTSDVAINVTGLPVTYTDANGNPVAKVGDNYYPVDENGNPITKKADGSAADPIDVTTLKTRLTNPSAKPNAIGDATQLGNVNSGLNNYAEPNVDGKAPAKNSLRNLADSTAVPDTIAATVGDLRNLGWIVSSDKTTGGNGAFSNAVKNANEVRFVGEGSAQVSANVTTNGVNVVTVKVDDQLTTNNSVTPVVYTKADGTQVYPVKDAQGNVTYNTKPDGTGDAVPDTDVITSVNGPKGTKAPTTLANVKSNLPQVNDADQTIYNPATNTTTAKQDGNANINKAPLTAAEAANIAKTAGNNAATVYDVLNAGWNLQNNGEARDFVKPYDTVNFVNGTGTIAVVTTDANGTTSDVTFNVDKGSITNETNGSVTGPVSTELNEALKNAQETAKKAQEEAAANPTDQALQDAAKKAQDAVDAAQAAVDNAGNKVATAQNVADAINNAGWNTNSTTAKGGATNTLIKPSKAVNFEAGKNMEVTQTVDENGNVSYTYATQDNVSFNTVNVGNPTESYTDENGDVVTKKGDKFFDKDGNEIDPAKVTTTVAPSVKLAAEKAVPANNNNASTTPTTALNISSADGKPSQITGVGSSLNTTTFATAPNGSAGTNKPNVNLLNLGTATSPLTENVLNSVATVRDLTNMGWIVSAEKGNGYVDTVKNANRVDFEGVGLVKVTGETNATTGVRTIKVEVPTNGTVNGVDAGDVNNNPNALMTAEAVSKAIKASGFNLTTSANGGAKLSGEDEIINPGDTVDMSAGKNLTVKQDAKGKVTYATADNVDFSSVTVGNPTYTTADGKPVTKQGDKFFNENGEEVKPSDVTAQAGQAVKFAAENAKPATNNQAGNAPSTALNVTSADGKPTQITGVGSVLDSQTVTTSTGTQGNTPAVAGSQNLVNLGNDPITGQSSLSGNTLNSAATVRDLANMGWVISAKDNDYTNTVKNANKVEFKGENGISVTGNTNATSGVREITVAIKTGSVDGNGDGSAKGDKGFVTGEQVADAINKSGWNLAANGTEGVKQINPTNTVTFDAGKNMQVVRDGANITYATKDDVNFNSVQFGDENGPKITNKDGNINVSGADGKAPTKITGIAAGDISPTSTDAVNGAQIYALTGGAVTNTTTITGPDGKQHHNVIVDEKGNPSLVTYNVDGRGEYITNSVITAVNNMNQQGIKFFHTNNGTNRDESMDQLTNGEDSRATGSFSTAIGYKAHAAGNNTVAFGSNATTAGDQAIAIGNNAQANGVQTISIGTGNIVNGNNSGAIGDPSVVNATSSYSVGNNNALATGQSDVFAMGNSITQTTSNSVFLGSQSGYVEAVTNADGSINEAASTTAGTKALTQQVTGGVLNQYAGGQEREVVGVVSVGTVGQDANGNTVQQTRRIQNVAPGLISEKSTDAINGSQLYSVASNFNNRLGDLNNKVNRNNKDLRAGIAGANAAAGLPQVYIPGKSMVAAAAGTFKGQSAVAVGYSRASDNGKVILKLQGNANTRGDVGGSVGVGFQW